LHIARSTISTYLLLAACAGQPFSPVTPHPGFFRMQLGEDEIVALNDGVVSYPTSRVLPSATPEAIARGLSANALTDPVGMSYNASWSARQRGWFSSIRAPEASSTTIPASMAAVI
jgi:hypothetical protein